MDHDSDAGERALPISKAILAVLERHGVPERQRLGTLEAAAGMSYQQVRRRMSGETPWNVDEIKCLATHFGEPLFKLLGSMVDDAGQPATLRVGGVDLPCSVWPGRPAPDKNSIGPLVTIPDGCPGHWIVLPVGDATGPERYEIKRLVFEAVPPRRVAVLDEEADPGIVQFLRESGLDAISYRTAKDLHAALKTARFDGFILDWQLAGGSSGDVLPTVRSSNPSGPIIILAGQLQSSGAQVRQLATTISTHRAQLYEKPTSMLSLLNALDLGFAASDRRR